MEQRKLEYSDGVYFANIDITVSEWKEMLSNSTIFTDESLSMIKYWYEATDYSATNKEIMAKHGIKLKGTPFNGIVIGLGKRIIKYLNRFEIVGKDGGKSYFILPFEGWHENYNTNNNFVWKLRSELIQAIEELNLFDDALLKDDDLDNIIIESHSEGKKKIIYSTKYERNKKNRRQAIELRGTKCEICDFDFEDVYGERGRGYIEVHHISPLYENQEEIIINPETDLICVCSNCHKMFHRKKDRVPSPEELRQELKRRKHLKK